MLTLEHKWSSLSSHLSRKYQFFKTRWQDVRLIQKRNCQTADPTFFKFNQISKMVNQPRSNPHWKQNKTCRRLCIIIRPSTTTLLSSLPTILPNRHQEGRTLSDDLSEWWNILNTDNRISFFFQTSTDDFDRLWRGKHFCFNSPSFFQLLTW